MIRLGFAAVIAAAGLVGAAHAQALPDHCAKPFAEGGVGGPTAADPTSPGPIGGCGTGAYKLHQYKKEQKERLYQQQMIGPKATGSGESL